MFEFSIIILFLNYLRKQFEIIFKFKPYDSLTYGQLSNFID